MKKWILLFCLSMSISSLVAWAEHPYGLNENQPYGILTSEYVTPHVSWANPYSQGKIKTLVLAPEWSQRETIELAQRLSLDYTAWMTGSFTQVVLTAEADPAFSFFQPPPELVYRLLRDFVKKQYDVIIVGKLDWPMIPAKQRFELLKKIAEGTGLIYVNPPAQNKELDLVFKTTNQTEGSDFITKNLPLAWLPRFKEKKMNELVKTFTFGKGRVVVLNYQEASMPKQWAEAWPCLTPQWDLTDSIKDGFIPLKQLPQVELVPYEYYQALVAKAAIWASKKEPEIQVQRLNVAEGQVTVELLKNVAGTRVKAVARHISDSTKVIPLGEKTAADQISFPLKNLPAGEYFVDVWALTSDGKKVLDWGSQYFALGSDFFFGDITLNKISWEPGEPIEGKITLPRLPNSNERIVLSLWDNYQRKIQVLPLKSTSLETSFRFDVFQPLTWLHKIEAQLVSDGKEICSTSLTFPIRAKLRWDDFKEVSWSGGENFFLTHQMLKKLSEADEADAIDIGWRGCTNARNIAWWNLAQLPYVARYGCFGAPTNNIIGAEKGNAYGCMSNPITLEAVDKWGADESAIYGPYAPLAWTHGDETNYASAGPDVCWCPSCLSVFRKYLQTVYADLNTLNQEWQTAYKTWDEVIPLTFKEAKQTGVYARWIEHRRSSDQTFADFYHRTGEALSKYDPKARAGFDGGCGLDAPNSGADWWTLSKRNDILHSYMGDSVQMEVFRAFADPNQVRGMWYGTYGLSWQVGPNTVPFCHFFPWYCLFHNLNTTWFWTMGTPGPLSGYAADLTSLPFFQARTDSLKQIKAGLGKLLLASNRQNDGIGIHFSEASRIAEGFFSVKDGEWSTPYAQSLVNFNKALEDCGLQYDYVSYEQVAKGELSLKGFKVFIMPHSRSVSDQEAQEIRSFVQKGGVVLADIIPGMLNGHGTLQKQSMLADLFPSDKAGTVTNVGKGKAILLGDMLAGYGQAHMNQFGWPQLKERWRELGKVLKDQAGVISQVSLIPVKSEKMPPTEVTRFQVGDFQFIGLLRENFLYDEKPYSTKITFPRKSHLYDVLSGKYLGQTDNLDTEISYRVKLFALSPYQIKAIHLTSSTVIKAGTSMSLQVSLQTMTNANPSRHAFRLEVMSPNGKSLPQYAQNLIAEKGNVSTSIPWALNDAPGKYAVTLRDVMSGVTAKTIILLK